MNVVVTRSRDSVSRKFLTVNASKNFMAFPVSLDSFKGDRDLERIEENLTFF